MNALVTIPEARPLTAVEIRTQVNLIQEVMQAVMIGPSKENPQGVHYGNIPGTPKPTLYKPGAEKLCMTFRIAPSYRFEDLSDGDNIRYRVTCIGTHQTSGIVMGEGVGEASTGEEKYKWRAAVCLEEFEATAENRRRVKYGKKQGGGFYTANQVRTEPADLANTVLKMACKRAHVAMTLNVLAASDIFTQDIEDLPEELDISENYGQPKNSSEENFYPAADFEKNFPTWESQIKLGKNTADGVIAKVSSKGKLTAEQLKKLHSVVVDKSIAAPEAVVTGIRGKAEAAAISETEVCEHLNVETLDGITVAQAEAAIAFLNNPMGN